MKLLLLTVVVAASFYGCEKKNVPPAPSVTPSPTPQPTTTPTPVPTGTPWPRVSPTPKPFTYSPSLRLCEVNAAQTLDVGAAANACQQGFIGLGEVVVWGPGNIASTIIVQAGNSLTLLADTHLTATTSGPPVLLREGATIQGMGWLVSSIRESSAQGQWSVVGAYNGFQRNGDLDARLTVRNLKVAGLDGKEFGSAAQAISLLNCESCLVENVWIDGTHAIGLQYGGAGFFGHHAKNSRVSHVLFTRVASQNLACVNCDGVIFEDFWILRPGQPNGPGSTSVDFEANGEGDVLRNNIVRRFVIDHRDTDMGTTGNGVVMQSAATAAGGTGNNLVEDGIIIGGPGGWEPEVKKVSIKRALYDSDSRHEVPAHSGESHSPSVPQAG